MYQQIFQKEFKYTTHSFDERVVADDLCDAIGRIAMNFSQLEDEISYGITFLLGTAAQKGLLVTSEMSFRTKVNVLASLVRMEYQVGTPTHPISELDFNDLVFMCQKSEELRNRLLHSSWIYDHTRKEVRRRKLSARIKRGFVHEEEPLNSAQVLDIADYIIYTTTCVDEFFINMFQGYERHLDHVILKPV